LPLCRYRYRFSYSKLKSHCTQLVLTIRCVTAAVVVCTIACRAPIRLCAQFVKRQAAEQRTKVVETISFTATTVSQQQLHLWIAFALVDADKQTDWL